jgi:hypothetical protein
MDGSDILIDILVVSGIFRIHLCTYTSVAKCGELLFFLYIDVRKGSKIRIPETPLKSLADGASSNRRAFEWGLGL